MTSLPELGVGIVYSPGLEPLIEAGHNLIDLIEIEPQSYWFRSRSGISPLYRVNDIAMNRFACLNYRKIIHGVGFPIGGTASPNTDHLAPFIACVQAMKSPWVSEHLNFNRVRGTLGEFNTGFLLPPIQTSESVVKAVANIRALKSHLPVPFAFETGANYLKPMRGEMSDGAFFRSVAEGADCGILLDLHNLWANQRNGRQSVLDAIAELPLDRIWEVHLAGGHEFRGRWLDAHSDLVSPELMQLAEYIVPCLPNIKALVFEIMADYLSAKDICTSDLLEQVQQLRRLWDRRLSTCRRRRTKYRNKTVDSTDSKLPSPSSWEEDLGSKVIDRTSGQLSSSHMDGDSGVEIYRHLVQSVRGGMVVATLTLTSRFITLCLGETQFSKLLELFWKNVPPQMFASDVASGFAAFIKNLALDIQHLDEVLSFELSCQQVLIEGSPQEVRFTCDPMQLLNALGEGRLPQAMTPGEYSLVIDPVSPEHWQEVDQNASNLQNRTC
jgi:uncharacterized protein